MTDLLLILLELFGEVICQLVIELLWEGIGEAFRWKRTRDPILSAFGWTVLGAATGAASLLIFPTPILRHTRFQGVSLIVAPLVTGSLMKFFGDELRSRGKKPTSLMTFWSGGMFALAFALVRFYWLVRV